jgi:biotin carboxyl carrier protein
MLKVTVGNGSSEESILELQLRKDQWFIGDKAFDGDIVKIRENHFHVIWKNRSFSVELVESGNSGKSYQFLINGDLYHTNARDQLDLLLEGLGMNKSSANKLNHVKAPMPGLIQSVFVQVGDEVGKGDNLLVLVAMKMENVIKAAGSGVVKSLKILPGEIVEKNQVLLEFQ